MVWPISAATGNFDAGTDSPATARGDLLDAIQKLNQLLAHVPGFMQTVLSRVDAASVRSDLGLAYHNLIVVSAVGNVTTGGVDCAYLSSAGNVGVANTLFVQNGISVSGGGASITGNVTVSGNISGFSDERIKEAWADLPDDFVQQLAQVRVGTYHVKGHPDVRYVGVSAQALREVLPEGVVEDAEGILSVVYGNVGAAAAVLIAREVIALRSELESLRGSMP